MSCCLLGLVACRDVSVPQPPGPPQPGTLQANLLYRPPGSSTATPAVGAVITLVGTSIQTTVVEDTGHFVLSPITQGTGDVLVQFDADKDGKFEAQRLLSLEAVGAGLGRDIALGPVVLGGAAEVRGVIIPRDRLTSPDGRSGITAFVARMPFTTLTGDNGVFSLQNLPEGAFTVSFFRSGYRPSSVRVSLEANQVLEIGTVLLEPETAAPPTARLLGSVILDGQPDASGVTVFLGAQASTTTDAAGRYAFSAVPPGLYVLGFQKVGFTTVSVPNVLVVANDLVLAAVTLTSGTSVSFDAGTPWDAGTGRDAGVDAGFGPVAVVDPVASSYPLGAQVVLIGQNSTGERPLVFRWSQDAGPTLTVPNNGTSQAATPTVTLPSQPAQMKLALTVVDRNGVVSLPAEFTLRTLRNPPVAVINPKPPQTVYAGQRVSIGSTGSSDPSGSGIVGYGWTLTPDVGATVVAFDGGTADLVMPATLAASTPMTVQLVVTDGLGVTSAPVTETFLLSNGTAPSWVLDAGSLQVVAGGSKAILTASTLTPSAGPTFSWQWTPTGVLDAGIPELNWQLSAPTSPTTEFIAPLISGPSQNIVFTVTATNTNGGLSPMQRSSNVMVQVMDQRRPAIAATSIGAMMGSPMGVWVDFDEDLNPTALFYLSVSGSFAPAPPARVAQLVGTRRVRQVFESFAPENTPLRLYTGTPLDRSPYGGGNAATGINIDYVAHFAWPAPMGAVGSSSTEPHAAVVLTLDSLGEPSAWLLGRKEQAAVFHQALDLDKCLAASCTLTEDGSAPVVTLSPTSSRIGPRVVAASGRTYVLLQSADYAGTPGVAVVRSANGWATIAAPPGTLFSDGTTLFSAYVEGTSVKVAAYDPAGAAWLPPSVVVTNAEYNTANAGSVSAAWGHASVSGAQFVIARTSSGDLRSYQRTSNTAAWTTSNYGPLPATTDAVRDVRIPYFTSADTGLQALVLHQSGKVTADSWGFGGTGSILGLVGVTAMDVFNDVNSSWTATIENGQLAIYARPSNMFLPMQGPNQSSFNNDPTCTADSPTIQRAGEHLVVAWQEKCGAGPWRAWMRWLR